MDKHGCYNELHFPLAISKEFPSPALFLFLATGTKEKKEKDEKEEQKIDKHESVLQAKNIIQLVRGRRE